MNENRLPKWPIAVATIALCVFIACGIVGGAGLPFDVFVIQSFIGWRGGHPGATNAVIDLTQVGSAYALIPVSIAAILVVGIRSRAAVWPFALTVIGGRLTIELIKTIVARPRPSFDAHPVHVVSQSFPSAHAGNSMTLFLAAALWLSTPRWRPASVALAVFASLLIGATRPILGVHWPTDVVGGWSFGIGWALAFWSLSCLHGRGGTTG